MVKLPMMVVKFALLTTPLMAFPGARKLTNVPPSSTAIPSGFLPGIGNSAMDLLSENGDPPVFLSR